MRPKVEPSPIIQISENEKKCSFIKLCIEECDLLCNEVKFFNFCFFIKKFRI